VVDYYDSFFIWKEKNSFDLKDWFEILENPG
jgi:hypothetical protein